MNRPPPLQFLWTLLLPLQPSQNPKKSPPIFIAIAMLTRKRRKNVAPRETNRQQDATDAADDGDARVRVSLTNIPKEVLFDILARLSVKSIFICRSLCKLMFDILISHDFANFHFSRAPTCPLLRNPNGKSISNALYLVELERDHLYGRVCDAGTRVNMKLSSRFMLPSIELRLERFLKYRRWNVVNSCNGLVCLLGSMCRNPFLKYTVKKYDMVVIYNPVTGEYIIIPTPEEDEFTVISHVGGLGFCPKTDQYKVLIVVYKTTPDPVTRMTSRTDTIAMICTLGSGLWRTVSIVPDLFRKKVPVFLNGCLHWYIGDCGTNSVIIYFNMEDEKFGIVPSQDHFNSDSIDYKQLRQIYGKQFKFTSVMRGCLCLWEKYYSKTATLWVMEEYGVKGSWVKEDIDTLPEIRKSYQPITYLNNGDLLMYRENNALISHDGNNFRCFKICGFKSNFEVVPHVPSFCSLKQMLGESIEVFNVRSRLANNECQGEKKIKPLYLVEKKEVRLYNGI